MEILQKRFAAETGGISPTAISTYLRCQLRFFYHYVCNLLEPDETDDELIDNRTFGNIFHKAVQNIYERQTKLTGKRITSLIIDDMLKHDVEVEQAVDEAFRTEFFHIENPERKMPPLDGMQLINREVIIRYVRQLLELDRKLTPFTILGLEKYVSMPLGDTKIGGIIDRLDSVTNAESGEEQIRVIDYKTGSHKQKDLPDVEAIFDPANIKDHSDYYLQAFIYSHIVRLKTKDPVSPALLFIQHAGADDYDPTLKIGKQPVYDIASESERFIELLQQKISEIFNPDLAFAPTDDSDRCRLCPYATICGRI
jgi:ATP-dependent helicase/DNAse subunit B